jgi:hypothetical protein
MIHYHGREKNITVRTKKKILLFKTSRFLIIKLNIKF